MSDAERAMFEMPRGYKPMDFGTGKRR